MINKTDKNIPESKMDLSSSQNFDGLNLYGDEAAIPTGIPSLGDNGTIKEPDKRRNVLDNGCEDHKRRCCPSLQNYRQGGSVLYLPIWRRQQHLPGAGKIRLERLQSAISQGRVQGE